MEELQFRPTTPSARNTNFLFSTIRIALALYMFLPHMFAQISTTNREGSTNNTGQINRLKLFFKSPFISFLRFIHHIDTIIVKFFANLRKVTRVAWVEVNYFYPECHKCRFRTKSRTILNNHIKNYHIKLPLRPPAVHTTNIGFKYNFHKETHKIGDKLSEYSENKRNLNCYLSQKG